MASASTNLCDLNNGKTVFATATGIKLGAKGRTRPSSWLRSPRANADAFARPLTATDEPTSALRVFIRLSNAGPQRSLRRREPLHSPPPQQGRESLHPAIAASMPRRGNRCTHGGASTDTRNITVNNPRNGETE